MDGDLDDLLGALPAIAIEGPKAVGKTATALRRAHTVRRLDDPAELALAAADPRLLLDGRAPILIDEWQRVPEVWDLVRRAVDDGAVPGSYLLTGSATPRTPPAHSGAGRIVTLRMRPLTIAERWGTDTVSLAELLDDRPAEIAGTTNADVASYVQEIVGSGFPGILGLAARGRRLQLEGYLRRVVDREIPDEVGATIRNPTALMRWMAAYAAATATTASFEKIRDAASAGEEHKRSRDAARAYRDALERVMVLDELPAWSPSGHPLRELAVAPKHHLADPALAAALGGVTTEALLAARERGGATARRSIPIGALFESLATLCVRVYAQRNDARVGHLRTARGRHEVDLIVERPDGGVVAIECKVARTVDDPAGGQLRWLSEQLGEQLLERVIISTGPIAYRRADGVAVIPLALLGP